MSGGVTRVIGPVDPEAARWASGLNDPATGRLAIIVPPGLPSFAALVAELLGAMGKDAERNPLGAAASETIELGLAWLAGHAIDRILLVHADWLREPIAGELCAFASLAGIDLACIVGALERDPFVAWATGEQAWFEFVAAETAAAGVRSNVAADPARHQLAPIGLLGRPAGRAIVAPLEAPSDVALASYIALVGRIRLDGRTEGAIANSVRLVLRTFSSAELPDAARGAAAALAKGGWCLRFDPADPTVRPQPSWADLRTSVHPYHAAAVALIAGGLWLSDLPSLTVSDVAADGSSVQHSGRKLGVPVGARPYLVAQRYLAVDEKAPFLTHRGRRLTIGALESAVVATMAEAGVAVDAQLLHAPRTPGLRWLASRGLTLGRVEAAGQAVRMARRCRHGIAGEFEIDGILLEHSQHLCRIHCPSDRQLWEVRPPERGFELEEVERSMQGVRIAVKRDDTPAGQLIGLNIEGGPVWLQIGFGDAPPMEHIVEVVAERYGVQVVDVARVPDSPSVDINPRTEPLDPLAPVGQTVALPPRPGARV